MPLNFAAYANLLTTERAEVEVTTGAGIVVLTLTSATAQGNGGSLEFAGPSNLALGQDTYPVQAGESSDVLFLVPIADDGTLRRYQAIFN